MTHRTDRRRSWFPVTQLVSRGAAAAVLLAGITPALAAESADETPQLEGWEGLRVIKQDGNPERMITADLDGDGREEIIVINSRNSHLDLYSWIPVDKRKETQAIDPKRPNELPMAPDWERTEVYLDELPIDAVPVDLDKDGKKELVILTSPSNKVVAYKADAEGKYTKSTQWDLLAGAPAGQRELMLVRPLADGQHELLVSTDQGIQALKLAPGARAAWMSPRENRGRFRWRLADFDGDGDLDLYEWSPQVRQTIRWYENRDGKLLPAQVLYDQNISGADALLAEGQPGELLLLGGSQEGLVRRFVLARGEENDLGRQDSLPMPGGAKAIWTGIKIDGKPALVAVDPSQPRLRMERLAEEGWGGEESFPIVGGIKAIAAPQGAPGTLLLWGKDGTDLLVSKWEKERMSYPQPMPQSAEEKDRVILSLGSAGDATWWAQRVGNDLDLYVWPTNASEPKKTRFAGAGAKTEKVVWIGGERALVQQKFAEGAKLVALVDGETKITDLTQLGKVDINQFNLYVDKDKLRVGRLTDGVVQWLDDAMQPQDQIMLGEGQRIASFVPMTDGNAWALEDGGSFIHRLEPDEAGILRIAKSIRPPNGQSLLNDPVLGLMLIDQERVVRLSKGSPWELSLRDSVDGRVGRPSGVKEATVHRVLTADVTGDGREEIILCDDQRHQLTVLERQDDAMKPVLSWTVYEDRSYPYGGSEGAQASEPRSIVAFDADGDQRQDMAMLCNDRLLIYLAREASE
jgi:hypothetical protein